MRTIKDIYGELEVCTDNAQRIELLAELSAQFLHNDMNRCMETVEQLGEIAKTQNHPKAYAYHYSGWGRINFKLSKFPESLDAFEKAATYAREAGSPLLESNCFHSMGMVYWKEGNFEKSLEMAYKALEFFEGRGEDGTGNRALCYNSLGNIYERMGDYHKAEEAYLKGMEVLEQVHQERLSYNVKGNLGVIKLRKKEYKEALQYLEPVHEGFKKLKHVTGEILTMIHIGHGYTGLRQYAKSMKLYIQALKLLKLNEDKFAEAEAHSGIARVYFAMDGYEEALKHYEKGMEIVKAIEYHSGTCEFYLDFANVYQAMDEVDKAKEQIEAGLKVARAYNLAFEGRKLEEKKRALQANDAKVA